jgi:hypothetical protein
MQRPHVRERWKVLADPIPHDPLHSFRRNTAPLWEWILEPGRDGQGNGS